jgi:hypothetical protein
VCSPFDPNAHGRNLRVAQGRPTSRHQGLVEPSDYSVERTLFSSSGHNRGAGSASTERVVSGTQVETGALEIRTMTLPAGRLHDRADVAGESAWILGFGSGGRKGGQHRDE